jgi:hypothetical protein
MTLDPTIQQEIVDAWQDQQGWANGLAQTAQGLSIPSVTLSGEIGVCYILNGPSDPTNPDLWEDDGDGSMELDDLTVSTFTGTTWAQASFPMYSSQVFLPVSFQTLAVSGSYSFGQPCKDVDTAVDKTIATQEYGGTGSVTQTATSGTLSYELLYDSNSSAPLELVGASVYGSVSTKVQPYGEDDILDELETFLTGGAEQAAVQQAVGNVFQSAQFSQAMVALMNQSLASGAAR